MIIKKLCILTTILLSFLPAYLYSDTELNRYIPIIGLYYPDSIVKLLYSIKVHYDSQDNKEAKSLSDFIDMRIKGYLWIDGFIIKDKNGNKIIITEGDLTTEVNNVTLIIIADGKIYTVNKVPIAYIDLNSKIAILPFPPQLKKYAKGFVLDTNKHKIKTPLKIAGYSHKGIKPVWHVFNGSQVSGGPQDIDLPGEDSYLLHNITEDLMEGGKPVLIEDKNIPNEYRVIGMSFEQNKLDIPVAAAYPAKIISKVIDKYNQSIKIQGDPDLLEQELKQNIRLLQYAITVSTNEDEQFKILCYLISCNYAFNKGFNTILYKLNHSKIDDINKIIYNFIISPTTEIKSLIIDRLSTELNYKNPKNNFCFKKIKLEKDKILTANSEVESIFKISDRDFKIMWIFEQGTWKIGDFDFTPYDTIDKNKQRTKQINK